MGPVQRAIRSSIAAGQELATPARGARFVVERIDDIGIVLLLGEGAWWTRLSWGCLEGVVPYLAGRGWVRIGSKYETTADAGTLDAYLKPYVKRATAAWVAAVLERAGIIDIDRSAPARVRLPAGAHGG